MAYEVYGPYTTVEDARKSTDILALEGLKEHQIHVFANQASTNDLNERIAAPIETNQIEAKLQAFDLSDHQVTTYTKSIADGDILIVANTEKRMGNDVTDDNTARQEPTIKHD